MPSARAVHMGVMIMVYAAGAIRSAAVIFAAGIAASLTPCAWGRATPDLHLVAKGGEAFPGRPGYTYNTTQPFLGARSQDAHGDLYFLARAKSASGDLLDDILVYRKATGAVESYARTGEVVDGSSANVSWGVVGGGQVGMMSFIERLKDPGGNEVGAVVVGGPGGTRRVMARDGEQAPGYAPPAVLSDVGLTRGAFLDVDMDRTGDVAYGAKFRDAGGVQRYGYYLTRADGTRERIIDSTMDVPGHGGAQWVSYDAISEPFDIYAPGLDSNGNAYFKAKYRMGGKDYRAFYVRTGDGAVTAVADSADTGVPGLPGYAFTRFRASVNNQKGDVAFGAEMLKPDGTPYGSGVFAKSGAGSLTRVLGPGDAVPGIPEAKNHSPGLMAMSDAGHILVTVNYLLSYPTGNLGGQSLVLYNPDGSAEPVLKFNETPGFPGQRAGACAAADVNSRGDVIFVTRMNMTQENWAVCAYLNDTNELVPVLKTGDILLGQTVVSFSLGGGSTELQGSIGASGGPVCWDDSRTCSLVVTLRGAGGVKTDVLYVVQVPAPAAALVIPAGLFAAGRCRRMA